MSHKHKCRYVIDGKCYNAEAPDKYKMTSGLRTEKPCNLCEFFRHVTGGSVATLLYRDEK